MTAPIIPHELIAAKARDDYARGADRDGHGFNPGASAIDTWQAEWDRCELARRHIPVDALLTVRRSTPP